MNHEHVQSMARIDAVAMQGFRYASGQAYSVELVTEMDLLAFNAGIRNANHHNGSNVDTFKAITTRRVEGKPQTSDKELSLRV